MGVDATRSTSQQQQQQERRRANIVFILRLRCIWIKAKTDFGREAHGCHVVTFASVNRLPPS